jgi:nitrogen fixation protein
MAPDFGSTRRMVRMNAKSTESAYVPFRAVTIEPLLDRHLPGGVIEFSHGWRLDLAVDVVRVGFEFVGVPKVELEREHRCGHREFSLPKG